MDDLARKLGFKEGDRSEWYRISNKTIIANGGGGLLNHFNGSLLAVLTAVYPEVHWDPLKFSKAPRNFWSSMENRQAFMSEFGKKLGFKENEREGWYKVSSRSFVANGGSGLLSHYDNSVYNLLLAVFPDFVWDPLKFTKAPQKFWKEVANQKVYMDEVGRDLGIGSENMEGWYKVSNRDLLDRGGSRLLHQYGGSLLTVLSNIYPDVQWDPRKFGRVPQNYWEDIGNQRTFMDDLARMLCFREGDIDAWYKVTNRRIIENGGSGLLDQYRGSLPRLLAKVYPEVPWKPWKFPRRMAKLSNDPTKADELISSLESTLEIKIASDWHRVSAEKVGALGMSGLLRNGKLLEMLRRRYPEENWDASPLERKSKIDQTISSHH